MNESMKKGMEEAAGVLSRIPDRVIYAGDFKEKGKYAVAAAVEACAAAGGGMVQVDSGDWETVPIHLKSKIHLRVEEGARLLFSSQFSDYLPVVFTRWEGVECYNYSPLIYAKDCTDIAITGKGALVGNGQVWWHWKVLQQEAATGLIRAQINHMPVEKRVYGTERAALRPSFVQPINCRNVWLEDLTVEDGPQWTIHPVYCENVVIRGLDIRTTGPNTDGINPDSCRNVLIEGCRLDTGDDCIAINSGMNEDGWRVNRPCENVEIRNCVMEGGHGGIAIGSGLSGGVDKIYAHDCVIRHTMQGIRVKSMRGRGGYVDHTRFENIRLEDTTHQAIQITMFYEYSTVVPKSNTPSDFRGIQIEGVSGGGHALGIQILGLPEHKMKGVSLRQIHLEAEQAMECRDVESMEWEDVKVGRIG